MGEHLADGTDAGGDVDGAQDDTHGLLGKLVVVGDSEHEYRSLYAVNISQRGIHPGGCREQDLQATSL